MTPNDTVVLGGSFNPPHRGHINLVTRLLQHFRLVVIAPTEQNPFKTEQPVALEHRAKMLELLVADAGLPLAENAAGRGVLVSRFPYQRTYEFVEHWRTTYGTDVTWCIGSDLRDEVKTWARIDELNLQFFELSEEIPIRSTDIRAGVTAPDAAILNYIEEHQLYGYPR